MVGHDEKRLQKRTSCSNNHRKITAIPHYGCNQDRDLAGGWVTHCWATETGFMEGSEEHRNVTLTASLLPLTASRLTW